MNLLISLTWLLASAFIGYTMIARVLGASPAFRARMMASTIGTKKQRDLPDPVPVVTTKLCPARALGEGLSLVPVKWKPLRPERENLGRFRANVAGVDEIVSGWPRFVSRIQGKKSVRPETAFLILAFNRLT